MKKIVVVVIMVCAMAAFVFGESFTVQNVTGRVQRESGKQKIDVKAGDTLDGETVISTGVGASIVLKSGEKTYNVPAARNGKVSELANAAAAVRIGGVVARTDTGVVGRTTGQVGTASARASDAAGAEDIASE